MGQYYNPCTVRKVNTKTGVQARPIKWMYSWDYDNGLKLMEHSWLKNNFVNTFAKTLLSAKPKRVVWAGDYADPEYKKPNDEPNLYDFCTDENKISPAEITDEELNQFLDKKPYLCNYDKKQYVDMSKLPKDNDGWRIHPLPLLTAEGNGKGGGDYYGNNESVYIGTWARNKIAFRTKPPKGFVEITPNFKE